MRAENDDRPREPSPTASVVAAGSIVVPEGAEGNGPDRQTGTLFGAGSPMFDSVWRGTDPQAWWIRDADVTAFALV